MKRAIDFKVNKDYSSFSNIIYVGKEETIGQKPK